MNKKFVLLFGVTGKTGYHIANCLISAKIPVRVVVRNKESVTNLFSIKQIAFESIIECKNFSSKESQEIFKQCLEPSLEYGPINIIISALGNNSRDDNIQQVQFGIHKKLIDLSVASKVSRYILITSAVITRPWNPIALILNMIVRNVLGWKAKAQNYLRNSGLNYTIVRPAQLVGEYNDSPTNYQIGQGDKLGGRITRSTVAKLIVDSLNQQKIGDKITFECTSNSSLLKQQYSPIGNKFKQLKQDDNNSIITGNHFRATSIVKFSMCSAIIGAVAYYIK